MAVKLTKRDQRLAAVIGAVAVLGGGYWMVLKPALANRDAASQRVTQAQSDLALAQQNLASLRSGGGNHAAQTALALRALKAIPAGPQTAGALVQLQALATRANVQLTGLDINQVTSYGPLQGETLNISVTGKFFDVSDFLYLMQNLVRVGAAGRPQVSGRLFAMNKVAIAPAATSGNGAPQLKGGNAVTATLEVIVFNTTPGTVTLGSGGGNQAAAAAPTGGSN